MNPDSLPRPLWRIIGAVVLLLGIVLSLLGGVIGYQIVEEVLTAQRVGVENLAIFFSLLLGFGVVLVFSGYRLLLIDRQASKLTLVPWQALIVSGLIIFASMVVFSLFATSSGQSLMGAPAKGIGMIAGLAISFIVSGLYQRQKRERRSFK